MQVRYYKKYIFGYQFIKREARTNNKKTFTVQGESMSAGRLYDRIGDMAKGVVKYVLPQGVLCELVKEEE